jgi:hypothetical protein
MGKPHSKQWTVAEEARLRALATKVPMDRLVNEIGRSRGAISAKAFLLRLSLDPRRNPSMPPPTFRSGEELGKFKWLELP